MDPEVVPKLSDPVNSGAVRNLTPISWKLLLRPLGLWGLLDIMTPLLPTPSHSWGLFRTAPQNGGRTFQAEGTAMQSLRGRSELSMLGEQQAGRCSWSGVCDGKRSGGDVKGAFSGGTWATVKREGMKEWSHLCDSCKDIRFQQTSKALPWPPVAGKTGGPTPSWIP